MSLFDRIARQADRDRHGQPLVVLLGVCGVALLGGVAWIVVAGSRLYADAQSGADKAAAVQAIAAGVTLTATVLLLGVTAWYAILTRAILRQTGPLVSADLRIGWLPVLGNGGVITAPLSSVATGTPDDRYPVRSWAISLRNAGNAATKVNAIAVRSETGIVMRAMKTLVGPCPIFTLEGHSAETVCVDFEMVIEALMAWLKASGAVSLRVCAEVELGSGIIVRSDWETLPN